MIPKHTWIYPKKNVFNLKRTYRFLSTFYCRYDHLQLYPFLFLCFISKIFESSPLIHLSKYQVYRTQYITILFSLKYYKSGAVYNKLGIVLFISNLYWSLATCAHGKKNEIWFSDHSDDTVTCSSSLEYLFARYTLLLSIMSGFIAQVEDYCLVEHLSLDFVTNWCSKSWVIIIHLITTPYKGQWMYWIMKQSDTMKKNLYSIFWSLVFLSTRFNYLALFGVCFQFFLVIRTPKVGCSLYFLWDIKRKGKEWS